MGVSRTVVPRRPRGALRSRGSSSHGNSRGRFVDRVPAGNLWIDPDGLGPRWIAFLDILELRMPVLNGSGLPLPSERATNVSDQIHQGGANGFFFFFFFQPAPFRRPPCGLKETSAFHQAAALSDTNNRFC